MAQLVKKKKKKCLQCRRPWFNHWSGKISWRKVTQPTPVFLPGEFHGQRSLAGYSPWGHKELNVTEWLTLNFHFANKGFKLLSLNYDAVEFSKPPQNLILPRRFPSSLPQMPSLAGKYLDPFCRWTKNHPIVPSSVLLLTSWVLVCADWWEWPQKAY